MENYTSSWIVEFFHSWPHITFSFKLLPKVDYSFTNRSYYETLAMIALMAVVWLVLTMIVFAVYLCCSKARRKSESYNSKGCYCSVCMLVIFVMISVGVIGVAVYGNIQASEGIDVAIVAVKKGNGTFHDMRNQVSSMHSSYDELYQSFNATKALLPENITFDSVEADLLKISQALDVAEKPLSDIEKLMDQSVYIVVTSEYYRRIATYSLLGFQCFLCFVALLGICCRSKCLIILMIVFGMICVTGTCFYLGADLTISVAFSDFCIQPSGAIHNYTVDENFMNLEQANYYIFCQNSSRNLLEDEIVEAKQILREYIPFLEGTSGSNSTGINSTEGVQNAASQLNESLSDFINQLDKVGEALSCDHTCTAVRKFSKAICGTTMEGFFTLAVAIFAMTICMSFMVCLASSAGRRYSRSKSRSSSFDDLDYSDPFLPRNTNYNSNSNRNITRTNNPIYATSTSSTSNYGVTTNTLSFFRPGSDEDVSLIDSPPPYSPPRILH